MLEQARCRRLPIHTMAQMDAADLEEDILEDLGFEEETKKQFRDAVAELKKKG